MFKIWGNASLYFWSSLRLISQIRFWLSRNVYLAIGLELGNRFGTSVIIQCEKGKSTATVPFFLNRDKPLISDKLQNAFFWLFYKLFQELQRFHFKTINSFLYASSLMLIHSLVIFCVYNVGHFFLHNILLRIHLFQDRKTRRNVYT